MVQFLHVCLIFLGLLLLFGFAHFAVFDQLVQSFDVGLDGFLVFIVILRFFLILGCLLFRLLFRLFLLLLCLLLSFFFRFFLSLLFRFFLGLFFRLLHFLHEDSIVFLRLLKQKSLLSESLFLFLLL